jgi:predicted XRE-type DNA-binding protein
MLIAIYCGLGQKKARQEFASLVALKAVITYHRYHNLISGSTVSQGLSTLIPKKLYRRSVSMGEIQVVDYTRWALKMAIMQRGLKQAHIAKALNKDQAWVSKVVNGWIDPSDEDTARLASALGLGVEELTAMFTSAA